MAKAKKMVKTAKKTVKKSAAKTKSKKVAPIPKGYHSVIPYLIVNQGMNAIEFYKKAFGAKVIMCMPSMTGEAGKVGHAELQIGDSKFMLGDECPKMNAFAPQANQRPPIGIHLYMKEVDAVIERAVAAGAKVTRPVANQFYGDRSGGIEDPFGHHWYVATHVEDVTPGQMKKRMAEMGSHKEMCEVK